MDTARDLGQTYVLDPLHSALNQLASFAPTILGALGILLLGWLIAKLIEEVIVRILKAATLDRVADQVQLSNVLVKGGIRRKLSELIGAIVYWIVILAFVMTSLNVLNLTVAADLFKGVVEFLPNVVAAVFILIVGVFAAAFLAATVRTAATNAGVRASHLLSQVVQAIVIIFAILTALKQLRIEFLGDAFLIILGGISLGSAIAFGLGCKDLAGRWVADTVEELKSHKR